MKMRAHLVLISCGLTCLQSCSHDGSFDIGGAPTGSAATTATETISPNGGSITLPGYGTITFPGGAFPAPQAVTVTMTADPDASANYEAASAIFGGGPRAAYELRVNSGAVCPATLFDASLPVPADFGAQLPNGFEPVVYAQMYDGSDEGLDYFEAYESRYSTVDNTVNVVLPTEAFTTARTGKCEAIITIGSAPTRVPATIQSRISWWERMLGRTSQHTAAPLCENRNAVHKVLAPPLDGYISVNSRYGDRADGFHRGTDYATHDASGQPVEGRAVRAIADGTISRILFHTVAVQVQCQNETQLRTVEKGWGQFIVVRHDDGSQSLYAHLQKDSATKTEGARVVKDEIIGRSGSTGTFEPKTCRVAPHLHVEFVPNAHAPPIQTKAANPYKRDVHPCVGRDLYVANLGTGDTSIPGSITRFDETQGRAATSYSSGLSERQTWYVAAFNRHYYVTGGVLAPTVYRDGAPFRTFELPNSVAATSRGVYVVDIAPCCRQPSTNTQQAEIFRLTHDGQGLDSFIDNSSLSPAQAPERVVVANDDRVVVISVYATRFYAVGGTSPIATVGHAYSSAGAAHRDRIYIAYTPDCAFPCQPQSYVGVYNNDGNITSNIGPISGGIWGVAASEKNLYVSASDSGQILIYDRTVVRDVGGNILTDTYTLASSITVGGFPMGLAVE